MTFAILTDSTADLDQNWAKEHQVTILGLTIELDGTVYQTVGQAQLTSPELLEEKICFMWPFHPSYLGPIRVQSWHETWF